MDWLHRSGSAFIVCGIVLFAAGCFDDNPPDPPDSVDSKQGEVEISPDFQKSVQQEPFGEQEADKEIDRFVLTNDNGMQVAITNQGGIVLSIEVPDRDGKFDNVTLGFETAEPYFENAPFFGAICGRYANRIAGGKFSLNGVEYLLSTNQTTKSGAKNHIHGGYIGFNKLPWHAESFETDDFVGLRLTLVSPDNEEGFPGNLTAKVVYTLDNNNSLKIDYTATSDKATPINLTSHCYFNLAGDSDILGHELTLFCDQYLPVDENTIPTGEIADVAGTPMDFTKPAAIGSRIQEVGMGYDHCYVVSKGEEAVKFDDGSEVPLIAIVREPKSGRLMKVFTTEPGVQLYTGNYLDGSEKAGGHEKHGGFCLECQHFPDSPNQPKFPNTILEPGEVYQQTTIYQFLVDE